MTHVRKNLIHKLNGDKENYSDNQGLVKNVTKVEISKGLGLDLNARIPFENKKTVENRLPYKL